MKRHLVYAAALMVLGPSLIPAQELVIHERRVNRQRITTIGLVPPPLGHHGPGPMGPGGVVPGPGGMVPGQGIIIPGPGGVIPPGTIVPAPAEKLDKEPKKEPTKKEPAKPEKEPAKKEPAKPEAAKPGAAAPGAVPGVIPGGLPVNPGAQLAAITETALDAVAWLGCNSFIDCKGRCWKQVSGQPYTDQPLLIGGLLLQGNDGSLQFFARSGRLFQLGVDANATGGPGAMRRGAAAGACPTGGCGATAASATRCPGGKCPLR